jgi:hypothetical protein
MAFINPEKLVSRYGGDVKVNPRGDQSLSPPPNRHRSSRSPPARRSVLLPMESPTSLAFNARGGIKTLVLPAIAGA